MRVTAIHRNHMDLIGPSGDQNVPVDKTLHDAGATVGDWLLFDDDGRFRRLLDRKSVFKRRAAGTGRQVQLIAANVDTLFIVTSCNQDFNIARLERYLVLAEEAEVTPVIVITKIDESDDAEDYRRRAERLRPGIFVEMINALEPVFAEVLLNWCGEGETVALVGSSGVGKSTIVNTLTGGSDLKTAGIRQDDAKGRHTTTGRALFRLHSGGWLIDTPGMRELQLVDVHDGIASVFDDITELAQNCRYSDCRHMSEPGCAVLRAIEDGELDEERLKRYHKLEAEERRNSESLAERRSRERAFAIMVSNTEKIRQNRKKT